jgi:hypothetical protein
MTKAEIKRFIRYMADWYGDDFVQQAVRRISTGDTDGAAWVFYNVMTELDRGRMDAALVHLRNPLAFQAGTQWCRFQILVKEAINAE